MGDLNELVRLLDEQITLKRDCSVCDGDGIKDSGRPCGGCEETGKVLVHRGPHAALLTATRDALTSLMAERDGLAKELEQAKDDTARLDYLDSLNASLNARHGTKYGWAMVVNQNVNRVMFNFPRGADLSDYNPHGFRSCRTAIDQRMAETAAYRRALSLDTNKGDGHGTR